jgi:hypothetical protein
MAETTRKATRSRSRQSATKRPATKATKAAEKVAATAERAAATAEQAAATAEQAAATAEQAATTAEQAPRAAKAAVRSVRRSAAPAAVTVPVPTISVRQVRVSVPGLQNVDLSRPRAAAGGVAHGVAETAEAVRDRMPDRSRLMRYGAVGARAALGVASWPVAAAIGVRAWVGEWAKAASSGRRRS